MEREPAVAGMFYPENQKKLWATVEQLIGPDTRDQPALAIVAPHAGYIYSGSIAGQTYREVHVPETAIVLCPNHSGMGAPTALMSQGAFRIPGRRVPIDEELSRSIKHRGALEEDSLAHLREHSLEVQLPFLVGRNPNVQLVPICLSHIPFSRCAELGVAIADCIRETSKGVLIVASSDMSHHLPAKLAEQQDRLALEKVDQLDAEGLYTTVVQNRISMCGFIPTAISIVAAKRLGASRAKLIRYGHSGEASGDHSSVVGYAGIVIH